MWIASDQSIEKSHLSRVAVLGIFYLRLGNPFGGDAGKKVKTNGLSPFN